MKKVLGIAVVALMMAGSVAMACDTCGCKDKKAEKKAECTACDHAKKCDKCTDEKKCEACTKKVEDKKAAEKKAEEKKAEASE